jgi:NADH-quinone oxidoreductase subunit J
MEVFHFALGFTLILNGFSVFISLNPIHSVLFLILTFCNAAVILFLFGLDFLALIFIMIYVGAIAILFLFIIMMLNIKNESTTGRDFIPFIFFSILSFTLQLLFILEKIFYDGNIETEYFNFQIIADNLNNIEILGQVLFNCFLICFLLAGFILLVAMIGAIVLTLNFSSKRKNELSTRQLSRSNNFLVFYS